MITNVSCAGSTDGIICVNIKKVPSTSTTYNIVIRDSTWAIVNTNGASQYPVGPTPPVTNTTNIANTVLGMFCWNNMPVGTYTIQVLTDDECWASVEVTIGSPSPLKLSFTLVNVLCSGVNGSITAVGSGGTPFVSTGGETYYKYSLFHASVVGYNPAVENYTGIYMGVPAHAVAYTLTIEDANGCTLSTSVMLSTSFMLSVITGSSDESCPGVCDGSVTALVSGGVPPYSITIEGENTNYVSSSDCVERCDTWYKFEGLCPDDYTVTVKDNAGCSVTSSIVTVGAGSAFAFDTPVIVNVTCNECCNGSITIDNLTGGSGVYEVNLEVPEGYTAPTTLYLTTGGTISFTDLAPGNYVVVINDGKCIKRIIVGIKAPQEVVIDA